MISVVFVERYETNVVVLIMHVDDDVCVDIVNKNKNTNVVVTAFGDWLKSAAFWPVY